MTRTEYQDMSTGYSPLRLATPSGTGEPVQPCVNCGLFVIYDLHESRWLHVHPEGHRFVCPEASS